MRKIKIVLTILAIAALLSACNSGDDAVLFDDGSLNADNRLEEILAAIDENDSDELENMFSKTTLTTLYKSIQEKGLPNLTNNAALENKAAFYYAATSGQRGQRQYASYVPRRETGFGGYIPRRRRLQSTGGAGCQGGGMPRRLRRLALDGRPRLCYLPWRGGGYILQSRPLSHDWERAGGLG